MSRLTSEQKIQPHWWVKTFAGTILGLTLAYAFVAIFAWFGPGGLDAPAKGQFNMWVLSPIALFVLSFTYLFKTALKAVVYLLSANIIVYSVFFLLRWLS
ncbi:hypothetical protein Q4503_13625 [Colwellia sp. 6_MG-2023]|jgi:hypothetical protein|uniref:hypothetical protein n=1 Tax=Colwellia sp. 6_MG-2023 TaxID=3062676 RepID=UPI0026E3F03B|nr:hypothetical protein [Colwellia sp. 6_MG-2023]MDO6488741.1 hypothetical protein [Colwellia sp. 6_MG-2023]